MKKTTLIAGLLVAALSLSGCGIYTSIPPTGVPKDLDVSRSNGAVSVAEEVKPESPAPAPVDPEPTDPKPGQDVPAKPADSTASTRLTKAEAEAIALKHAGFTAEQVKGLKSELDIDPGIAHYEVEFRVGQWEYDYDIHAETGAVLSFEKDD